ncbi:MAG: tetratricopeptide repeat protein, partial [Deltaproteobacteria bacterium]|nr:tetratricopeptide repeat protein [Deltaproteobacteria bacterium]
MASNEVLKVKTVDDNGRAGIMVFFRERPSYNLYAASEAHILLTFDDTVKGGAFEKDIPEGDMFDLNEALDAVAVRLDVNLQSPFTRVDSSWIEDKKLLYIEIETQTDPAGVIKPYKNETSLQDVRFGFIESGTRMVMKVGSSPSWKMAFDEPSIVKMRLIDVSNDMKKSKFGPVKRLKGAAISGTKDKATELYLELESPLIRVSVLRMSAEGRLVLDIMDQPAQIPDDAHASKSETPIIESFVEGEHPEGTIIEDKGNYLRMKIGKKESSSGASVTAKAAEGDGLPGTAGIPAPDGVIESGTDAAGEKGIETDEPMAGENGLKTDIARSDDTDSGINNPATPDADAGQGANTKAADTADDAVKIAPRLDNTMPMTTELTHAMEKLSPEEAFLYGRIKQAMDIKDYKAGLLLIDQFLNELPDSSLVEDMMFLRGDLYYCLWQNGDNEAPGEVITSYEKAIDSFPDSVLVPSGYIKMAQAQSSKGEEYLALGYLGLVITRKDVNELMPLAYLTRGKIFMRLKQYEKALADFKVIEEQYADSEYFTEAHFWTANYYHAVGRYEDAEKILEEVLDLYPAIFVEYPEYLFLRAKNYLYLEDYDGAREYLFKALNIGRQQEGADMLLTRIGDTYHNQENEKEAEKFYRMVVDYYPETEGASISRLRMADYSSDTSVLDEISTYTDNESISELALLQKGYQQYDKEQYASVVGTVKPLVDKTVETETRKSAKRLFLNAAEKEIAGLYQGGKFKELTDFYSPHKDLLDKEIKAENMIKVAMAFKGLGLYEQAILTFKGIKLSDLDLQQGGAYFTG